MFELWTFDVCMLSSLSTLSLWWWPSSFRVWTIPTVYQSWKIDNDLHILQFFFLLIKHCILHYYMYRCINSFYIKIKNKYTGDSIWSIKTNEYNSCPPLFSTDIVLIWLVYLKRFIFSFIYCIIHVSKYRHCFTVSYIIYINNHANI